VYSVEHSHTWTNYGIISVRYIGKLKQTQVHIALIKWRVPKSYYFLSNLRFGYVYFVETIECKNKEYLLEYTMWLHFLRNLIWSYKKEHLQSYLHKAVYTYLLIIMNMKLVPFLSATTTHITYNNNM